MMSLGLPSVHPCLQPSQNKKQWTAPNQGNSKPYPSQQDIPIRAKTLIIFAQKCEPRRSPSPSPSSPSSPGHKFIFTETPSRAANLQRAISVSSSPSVSRLASSGTSPRAVVCVRPVIAHTRNRRVSEIARNPNIYEPARTNDEPARTIPNIYEPARTIYRNIPNKKHEVAISHYKINRADRQRGG